MPIETIQSILSVEARASEITASAERKKTLAINHAKEEAARIIERAKDEAKSETSRMIEKARAEAQEETLSIERACGESILEIKERSKQGAVKAKKLCL